MSCPVTIRETPYDPYGSYGDKSMRGAYRSIGINRNDFMALIQMQTGYGSGLQAGGMDCLRVQCI